MKKSAKKSKTELTHGTTRIRTLQSRFRVVAVPLFFALTGGECNIPVLSNGRTDKIAFRFVRDQFCLARGCWLNRARGNRRTVRDTRTDGRV